MKSEATKRATVFGMPSRFSGLSAYIAMLLIGVICTLIVFGILTYHPFVGKSDLGSDKGDLKLYRAIVDRVHLGEGYYAAAGRELRARGYATASVFNWRLPFLARLLALLPSVGSGRIVAILLASLMSALWVLVFARNECSFIQVVLVGSLMQGLLLYSMFSEAFLMHEFWSGTLIAISLAAYALRWRFISLLFGLAALFLRELALPFVCVMCVLAYKEDERKEALVWLIGGIVFAVELSVHSVIVRGLLSGQDMTRTTGWIAFGGWQFVLDTASTNAFLGLAPNWVTPMVLPFLLLGFGGWSGGLGSRVGSTVGIYVLAFLFVGLPCNSYWGLMFSGLLPLGILFMPHCTRDIWESLRSFRKADIFGRDKIGN